MPQPYFMISTYLIRKQVHNHLDKVQLLWNVYNYELEKFNIPTSEVMISTAAAFSYPVWQDFMFSNHVMDSV